MEPGTLLGSHRVEMKLGEGGMADVYKVWNTGLHRHEALKAPKPHFAYDPTFVSRFLTEARTAAGLQHPHIATIHTVSDAQAAQPFFTMELVDGGDLADLLRQRGRLEFPEAIALLRQIGEALDYAHARGIIHRDVKPANVLLQADGRGGWSVKVVDFGIARAQEAGDGARLTKTGMIVGTPEYMSPEQGGSGAKVDQRTDVYSLGVIAYEMLCGRPPFSAGVDGSAITVIMSHIREQPRPPVQQVPGLPLAVNNAVLKALAKNPADRFETCASFCAALMAALPVKVPTAGVPAPPSSTTLRQTKQSPWGKMILCSVAAVGVALVILGLINNARTKKEVIVKVSPYIESASFPSTASAKALANSVPPTAPTIKRSVAVPDLVGLKEAQARALLAAKSLVADVTTMQSTEASAGTVAQQKPEADADVDPSTSVRVWISTGPPQSSPVPTSSPATAYSSLGGPHGYYQPSSSGSSATSPEDRAELQERYSEWLAAWQRMNLNDYLSFYSSEVTIRRAGKPSYGRYELGQKMSDLWAKQSFITVQSDTPSFVFSDGRAVVTAHQSYDSTTYWDQGVKTLTWAREDGVWRIVEEAFSRQAGGAK